MSKTPKSRVPQTQQASSPTDNGKLSTSQTRFENRPSTGGGRTEFDHYPEAQGEDVKERPQPADEPTGGSEGEISQSDLLDTMRRTIERLEKDGTTRGDLKILSRTLRELRYAFKVFSPTADIAR